jgi:ABC-type transport system involved in multi-copper enzyme maturation permease subunit
MNSATAAQIKAIFHQEFWRYLFRPRGAWVYLLAFGPALIVATHCWMLITGRHRGSVQEDTNVMAGIFLIYYLRLGIYFSCLGIFTRLFRGDMVERTLHYYFLAPVRREVLVAGKFLAGLCIAALAFGGGVALCFGLMYAGHGEEGLRFLTEGPGLQQLGSYLLVTVLACTGYGALFLLFGLLFKNPIIPAVVVMIWEGLNHFLPNVLKKFSVIFYLEPLCPVELPIRDVSAIFAVSPDPVSAWIAIPGLFAVAGSLLAYACHRSRSMEINYSAD